MTEAPRLALLVQSASHNRLHAMVSLVATAIALGGEAHVFLTHEALKVYLEDRMDETPPDFADPAYQAFYETAVEDERTPRLGELLVQAQAKGRVNIYGCQASVLLWRKYSPEQLERLTAVIGHSTFLTIAQGRQLVFI